MNPNSSDTQSAELPANAEQTEPADLAPEGDEAQAAPEVAPEVEQPAAEIPPAGTEESLDVTPTTDTPATDAEPSAAEATTPVQPEAEQPAAETPAEQPAAETPAEPPAADAPPAPADVPVSREEPAPGAGPKIIGRAEDVTPPPVPAVKQSLKDVERAQRPRRRRLNATQRHRNVFFARLNEFRRQAQPRTDHEAEMEAAEATSTQATEAAEAQTAEATEAAVDAPAPEAPAETAPVTDAGEAPAAADAEATVETPADADAPVTDAGEAPAAAEAESTDAAAPAAGDDTPPAAVVQADEDEHSGEPGQKRRSTPPPPVDRARLVAAIERAGGPEAVLEALQPKRDENDQPLKWATVCADACKGLKPSDPVFSAWVRLAATPVSAIKRELGINERPDRGRGGRGGPGRGRDNRGGPRRGRDDRGGASREDFQRLSRGGSVGANIRIIGLNDEADEKQEREARRKAEREAKRQAERERLARLGY